MRYWKFLISVLMLLSFTHPAYAQDALTIDRLQIDIWPEYDRPGVLVIYRINLSQNTPLPAEVTLRIPHEVKKPFNLAMQNADGLYNLKYDTTIAGDWALISFSTPSPNLQIEYYDPRIQKDNSNRLYEYRWPGDYAVHALTIQVQKPLNASQIKIEPDMGAGILGKDGMYYFTDVVGEVPSGTTFTVSLSYTKPDDKLSVNLLTVESTEPITDQTTGRVSFIEMLPWMVGGLGVLLIGGGGLWYWQSSREEVRAQGPHQSSAERHKSQATPEAQSNIYCHQCGKRAGPGDVYCRSCGARLRVE
jgi:hypothetical protein